MYIRPYEGGDESQLLNVWRASMTADCIDETTFRTKVLLDSNFQAANLPVAIDDGRVVGFVLILTRQVPLFLQGLEAEQAWITAFGVLPAYRRRGIATALFRFADERLKADGRKTLSISPYVPNYFTPGVDIKAYPAALEFLALNGFKTVDHAISMGVDLSGFQIPDEIQVLERQRERDDGVTIRPVNSADIPDLMPFIQKHFGWDWFRFAQEYLQDVFGGQNPRAACLLVARRHGEIVGYCQQRFERFGPFGVDPAYRNLGIGRLLLFRCLATMSARQIYFAYFLWTGDDAARLYSLAGFKPRREFALLQKEY
ncbi:MAG TPA: GNAT family N-acetyltransferase [Phototrophicaceae bacterium]|nr:GNAT family N-acetyltransferase [Phototrophicaceae bacterium]